MDTSRNSCRLCNSSLLEDSQLVTCLQCDAVFHRDCARAFPSMGDDLLVDCCVGRPQEQQDNVQDNQEFFDAMEKLAVGSRDSSIFCYILKQKDEIIHELREKIRILNNQVGVLSEARRDSNRRKTTHAPTIDERMNTRISRRKLIVGTNSSVQANGKDLKGVPNYIQLHVHRTDPNMTAEDLEVLLREKFPEVYCEQILSRRPDVYSSFKVSILAVHLNEAMDPAIWPEGAYVQRFINFKKMEAK